MISLKICQKRKREADAGFREREKKIKREQKRSREKKALVAFGQYMKILRELYRFFSKFP